MVKFKLIYYYLFLIPIIGWSQNDTIQLKNKNVLMGEVKSYSKGVLIMETPYSDKDFRIEFNKIESLVIQRKCLILLTEGRRRFGYIKTNDKGLLRITAEDGTQENFKFSEVIALDEVDDNFWKRISGSIDFSFSLSKANSLTQFNIGGELNYIDEAWMVDGTVNLLNSYQDNVDRTKRTEAQLELYRILPRKWYLIGDLSFLSNTEQALEGRVKPSIGIGKFLVSTNKLYLGLSLGYAYNIENYLDATFDKSSSESFIKIAFSMFDFEDIDLDTSINFYPSLSEKERLRIDYDLSLKYDLPLDLYIKLGFILNYDNQPASSGNDVDYVLTSGFGWEFN